jgi:hypothetical protein
MFWPVRCFSHNRRCFFYQIPYYRFYSRSRPYSRYSRRLRNPDFSFHFVLRILMRLIDSRYMRLLELGK